MKTSTALLLSIAFVFAACTPKDSGDCSGIEDTSSCEHVADSYVSKVISLEQEYNSCTTPSDCVPVSNRYNCSPNLFVHYCDSLVNQSKVSEYEGKLKAIQDTYCSCSVLCSITYDPCSGAEIVCENNKCGRRSENVDSGVHD